MFIPETQRAALRDNMKQLEVKPLTGSLLFRSVERKLLVAEPQSFSRRRVAFHLPETLGSSGGDAAKGPDRSDRSAKPDFN